MFPWRPLGMLAFGLAVIYSFVHLHGEGYDFPVRVSRCNDTVEYSRQPDRTFLEVTSVYLPELVLFTTESDFDQDRASDRAEEQERERKKTGEKEANAGGSLWQSQWLKMTGSKDDTAMQQGRPVDGAVLDRRGHASERQWIWMTNLWYDDGDCGPGHVRQYRRPLDKALASDNTSTWEHMYTHELPGPIVHTSLSKRVLPHQRWNPSSGGQKAPESQAEEVINNREVVRLAVVYKVIQDEHVAYHSRIYHFGVFSASKVDLRADCGSTLTETCHSHRPFQSFDYILPGSTAIKDFSLEHDRILYSRLSDVAQFRTLQLPRLEPGSTSPEKPHPLTSGTPGPPLKCGERQNAPFRMSFLAQFQAYPKNESYILMAKVVEIHDVWEYHTSIASVVPSNTEEKEWAIDLQWWHQYQSLVQENDLIDDDPYIHGDSIQRPYMVRSSDGSSIHIPVENMIRSLDLRPIYDSTKPLPRSSTPLSQQHPPTQNRESESNSPGEGGQHIQGVLKDQTDPDGSSASCSSPSSPIAAADGAGGASEVGEDARRDRWQELYERLLKARKMKYDQYWTLSRIESGPMESVDTEQGVINDRADVMVLKNSHNGILVLRRPGEDHLPWSLVPSMEQGMMFLRRSAEDDMQWRLSMAMSDKEYYIGKSPKREVLAMKIVRAIPIPLTPLPMPELLPQAATSQQSGSGDTAIDGGMTNDDGSSHSTPEPEAVQHQNILLIVFGDGKLAGYNLDQPEESSSVTEFLEEKKAVVFGMLAVVIAFVINEAR